MQILYLSISGMLCILLRKYKKTFYKALANFIWLYFVILMCFSYTNNDTLIYQNIYKSSVYELWTKDIGFGKLLSLFHSLNFTYEMFRFTICFCALILMRMGVRKLLKKYECFYWMIYFVYPLLLDNIEIRNFLAYSVLIFALPFLFDSKKRKILLFFILFFIAGLIHKIIFIYTIPLLVYRILRTTNKERLLIYDLIFIFVALIGVNKGLTSSIFSILPVWFRETEGISRNLITTNNNGWIVNWCITVCFYISARLMYQNTIKLEKRGMIDRNEFLFKYLQLIFIMSLFGAILIPFYVLSGDLMRVIRNMYALVAIGILCTYERVGNFDGIKNIITYSLFFLVFAELGGVASAFYSGNEYMIIYDIFVNNWLFNLGKLKYTWSTKPWQ